MHALGIKSRARLVEAQGSRIARQGPGNKNTACLTGGQRQHVPFGKICDPDLLHTDSSDLPSAGDLARIHARTQAQRSLHPAGNDIENRQMNGRFFLHTRRYHTDKRADFRKRYARAPPEYNRGTIPMQGEQRARDKPDKRGLPEPFGPITATDSPSASWRESMDKMGCPAR